MLSGFTLAGGGETTSAGSFCPSGSFSEAGVDGGAAGVVVVVFELRVKSPMFASRSIVDPC
jgi:hypothetical protein